MVAGEERPTGEESPYEEVSWDFFVSIILKGLPLTGLSLSCFKRAAASESLNFLLTSMFVGEPVGEFYCMNLWIGDKPSPYLGDSIDLTGDLVFGRRCE
jgi:hypothetical protein